MPCYRCGVRQTDPSRGQSPWKRGVLRYSQILICPGCQDTADWMSELDRCSQCSSVHLVKRLGEVECRDCGAIMPPSGEPGRPGLADDEPAGAGRGGAGPGSAVVARVRAVAPVWAVARVSGIPAWATQAGQMRAWRARVREMRA